LIYQINDVFKNIVFLSVEGYYPFPLVDRMHAPYKGELFSKLVYFKHGGVLRTSTCPSIAHAIKDGIFGDYIYQIDDIFFKDCILRVEGYLTLPIFDHMHNL